MCRWTVTATMLFSVALLAAEAEKKRTITFAKESVGKLPKGWTATHTGKKGGGIWKVVADRTAPSKTDHVLAQTGASPGPVFNLCLVDGTLGDGTLTVMFKANKGKKDQGGGLVWRYVDADNYYIARFNPLESNFRLYKVVEGSRKQLATREDIVIKAGTWHSLAVTMIGDEIACSLDSKKLLTARDQTFKKPGKIGLWTKADAQTSFDNLTIEAGKK